MRGGAQYGMSLPRSARAAGDEPFVLRPGDGDGDLGAEACGESNQLFEGEALEPTVAEIRHARLVGVDERGRVPLRPAVKPLDDVVRHFDFERWDGVGGGHRELLRSTERGGVTVWWRGGSLVRGARACVSPRRQVCQNRHFGRVEAAYRGSRQALWHYSHSPPRRAPRPSRLANVAALPNLMTVFISLWTMFITYDIASAACS